MNIEGLGESLIAQLLEGALIHDYADVLRTTRAFPRLKDHQVSVFTDAYTEAWKPSAKPFMTAIVTFADEGGKTRYTARALHWTAEDKKTHEEMGFHQGWGICADQLAALAAKI